MSTLHQRVCQGVDKAGEDGSDYELWSPSGSESTSCLMGHKVIRRSLFLASVNSYRLRMSAGSAKHNAIMENVLTGKHSKKTANAQN